MNLRVNHILESSKVQGPGERFTIWVQGCSIRCIGCNNQDTWSTASGDLIPTEVLTHRILKSSLSLTITGGEPLDQLEAILEVTKEIFPSKDIFLCSGYSFDFIRQQKKSILESIDIICTGPFDKSKVCQSQWKGSNNQEVIYLTERGRHLLDLPIYKREYRIDKTTGNVMITGFSM